MTRHATLTPEETTCDPGQSYARAGVKNAMTPKTKHNHMRAVSTVRLWGEIRGVDARTHYFELVLAAALLPAVADGSAAGALACLFGPKCAAGLRPVCAL